MGTRRASPADEGGQWSDTLAQIDIKRVVAGAVQTRKQEARKQAERDAKMKKWMAEVVHRKIEKDPEKDEIVKPDEDRTRELALEVLKQYPTMAAQIAGASGKTPEQKIEALISFFSGSGQADRMKGGRRLRVSVKGASLKGFLPKKNVIETISWGDFMRIAEEAVKSEKRPKWMLPPEKLAAWKKAEQRRVLAEQRKRKVRERADARWLKKHNRKMERERVEWHRHCDKMAPIWKANKEWLKKVAKEAAGLIQKRMGRAAEGDEIAAVINKALLDRGLIKNDKKSFNRKGWVMQGYDSGTGRRTRKVYFESALNNYDTLIPGAVIQKEKAEATDEE